MTQKMETIFSLKKKSQELENLKFDQSKDSKKQTKLQQDDIDEKMEHIFQLEKRLVQMESSNGQLQYTVSDLRLKLSASNKEMHKEVQKVKDLETYLKRLKSDLHNCVSFIQEPKKLQESVKVIYAQYVREVDSVEKSSAEKDCQRTICDYIHYLKKIVVTLQTKLDKSAKENEEIKFKMTKETLALITEINGLREALHLARTQVKEYDTQLARLKKSKKSRLASKNGPQEQLKPEDVN